MKTIIIYFLIFSLFLVIPFTGNTALTAFSKDVTVRNYVILDAGHGGVDGGAISCTGISESNINLEIALRLNDLMHLLGMRTIMICDDDRSVYTEGTTIATKKISDIRNRVRIVNETPNALLVSIHQNNFSDPKYSGAQGFYNNKSNSKEITLQLHSAFRENLDITNKRQPQNSSGVYLMEHINCPGVLIECGFLSNVKEEAMLRDDTYQKKICSIVATTICKYLNT